MVGQVDGRKVGGQVGGQVGGRWAGRLAAGRRMAKILGCVTEVLVRCD